MFKTVLAAALFTAGSAFAAGNIVVDGSFESVNQGAGTYGYYPAGIAGWTVSSGPSVEVRDALVGNAEDGNNFVELDSTSNSGISQVLATVAGQTYTLSFYYSNRAQDNGYNNEFAGGVVPASTQGLTYDVGGGAVAVAALPANTTTDNQWAHYTTTFTASGPTTLTFDATGTSDSLGSSLDNIEVSAVPEPAPLALMGAGLLVVAGIARRRRDQA
jgi:hypothetical protein